MPCLNARASTLHTRHFLCSTALRSLEQALVCLTQLNGLSWGSYLPGPSQQAAAGAAAGVARSYSAWARSFRPQSIRQLSLRDAGYEALPEDLYEGGSGDGATVSPQPARGVEHVRSGGNEGSAHGRAAEAHAEECEEVRLWVGKMGEEVGRGLCRPPYCFRKHQSPCVQEGAMQPAGPWPASRVFFP